MSTLQEFPSPTISPVISQHNPSSWPKPRSIIEKEYKELYLAEGQQLPYINTLVRSDLYYHLHLSGITVLGLAPTHPIITKKLTIVDFQWKKLGPNGQIQLSGKRKAGAVQYQPDDIMCIIECEGGIQYYIKPYIRGKLIDTNALFTSQPQPLQPKDENTNNQQGNKGKNRQGKGRQNKNIAETSVSGSTIATTITEAQLTDFQPPRAPIPPPAPIRDPKLIEQYRTLQTDPSEGGYLCMLLLSPEQMQLMLRLFLSQRDFSELKKQQEAFFTQFKPHISSFRIPHLKQSSDFSVATLSREFIGSGYLIGFKKGEFKQRHGVYKNMFGAVQVTTTGGSTMSWNEWCNITNYGTITLNEVQYDTDVTNVTTSPDIEIIQDQNKMSDS